MTCVCCISVSVALLQRRDALRFMNLVRALKLLLGIIFRILFTINFFRVTKIPENTRICFLDDQFHSLMEHDNVYYINLKPYEYSIPFEEMALRYYTKINNKIDKDKFIEFAVNYMKKNYNYEPKSNDEHNVDKIISKKILTHL